MLFYSVQYEIRNWLSLALTALQRFWSPFHSFVYTVYLSGLQSIVSYLPASSGNLKKEQWSSIGNQIQLHCILFIVQITLCVIKTIFSRRTMIFSRNGSLIARLNISCFITVIQSVI